MTKAEGEVTHQIIISDSIIRIMHPSSITIMVISEGMDEDGDRDEDIQDMLMVV